MIFGSDRHVVPNAGSRGAPGAGASASAFCVRLFAVLSHDVEILRLLFVMAFLLLMHQSYRDGAEDVAALAHPSVAQNLQRLEHLRPSIAVPLYTSNFAAHV